MQVTEIKSEGLRREFKIAVPATEIEEKINVRLASLARTAQLPGFRPGKVPVTLLRKKYGTAIMGEVLENAVNDTTRQTMSERGLRPAGQPKIEITAFEDGGSLEYTLMVDLLPEIRPIDLKTLKLERMVVAADEARVEETLKRLAEGHKSSTSAPDGHASRSGDVAVIDFVGMVDGKEFPGGKAEGYALELGSGSFIPGFEDQLIGVKAGAKVAVKVTFPETYGAADLAGKEAVFDVTVREVRTTAPAAIDDGLAAKVGLANLEVLKAKIREEQGREYKELARLRLKRSLFDSLYETHEFEVPQSLLDSEFETIWKQFEEQRAASKEAATDKTEAAPQDEKSDEVHKAEFRQIAERRVRLGLLLAEIGRLNNIQVSQDDIHRAIMTEARRFPGQEQAVVEYYRKTPAAMQALVGPLYEDKVVDFILEMASIVDRSVSLEELLKSPDEEGEAAHDAPEAKRKKASAKKPTAKKGTKKDKS
jgi:trigger factor